MILVDANLLIYAIDAASPQQGRARPWLERTGNLTSDAHIAALALERGATVCSTDHDFGRFPGIRHVNPLTAT